MTKGPSEPVNLYNQERQWKGSVKNKLNTLDSCNLFIHLSLLKLQYLDYYAGKGICGRGKGREKRG